ncbi:hypothetical protein HYS92_01510 [Candidatus Daviesbacteria bacterium]|nr:hypothetical protein [Candidatus Daviesbacteria bacterium]
MSQFPTERGGAGIGDTAHSARRIVRQEINPLNRISSQLKTFTRTLDTYQRSLNVAVVDKDFDNSLVPAALGVIGYRSRDFPGQPDQQLHDNSQKLFNWFNKKYGPELELLFDSVKGDEQARVELEQMIGENLAHWVVVKRGFGQAFRPEIERKQIGHMAQFLIQRSTNFQAIKDKLAVEEDALEEARKVAANTEVAREIIRLEIGVGQFETREWVAQTGKEARAGKKTYETPHYTNLIEGINTAGRKANGVGGVVLYGPPGTGKTEVLIEKNKQQGYKTRIIQIHHYSSFNDLLADKALQLGLDKSASTASKSQTAIEAFGQEKSEEFGKDFVRMFNKLRQEGKLREDETIGNFIGSFVSAELQEELIGKSEIDPESWERIQQDFVAGQRARLLRTAMDSRFQEGVEDVVAGEILLAIEKGQRVVLDEIDKAGPNSLGGLLSFLSKSKGEIFEYGQTAIEIPDWFVIDATTNTMELSDFLKDRFTPEKVDTPPLKDQLMIAAVRLADPAGNILISEDEQRRFISLFTYVMPEVNNLLKSHNLAPVSIRGIQEITSALVNFYNPRRTNTSYEAAVRNFFHHLEVRASSQDVTENLARILTKFNTMIASKPYEASSSGVKAADSNAARPREKLQLAVGSILNSPLLKAISALDEMEEEYLDKRISAVSLNARQQQLVGEYFKRKQADNLRKRPDALDLPIGLRLQKKVDDQRTIRLVGVSPSSLEVDSLYQAQLQKDGRLVDASSDGRVLLLASPNGRGDNEAISVMRLFSSGVNQDEELKGVSINKGHKVAANSSGSHIGIISPEDGTLSVYKTVGGVDFSIKGAKNFSFSDDGSLILVELNSGKTQIGNLQTNSMVANLEGSWQFITSNLVAQMENGIPSAQALLIRN